MSSFHRPRRLFLFAYAGICAVILFSLETKAAAQKAPAKKDKEAVPKASAPKKPAKKGAPKKDEYFLLREQMVEKEVVGGGVRDPRVLDAVRTVQRHEFISPAQRESAYFDMALPIGHGQTISPPYVVAYMTEQLDPQPRDRVLEIGTGSGYQAAVLGELAAEVYTIEIVEPLGKKAEKVLRQLHYDNVHTKIGDGYLGWEEHAPFDKIIVTCSPENIPQPLIDQLKEGGRIVVPLGERFQQTLYLFTKVNGKLKPTALQPTFFVPMTGKAEDVRAVKPDPEHPRILNGDFKKASLQPPVPDGWYYIRQATIVHDPQAPRETCLTFKNATPGRNSQALQAVGLDGRYVREVTLSFSVKADNAAFGRSQQEQPRIVITYFDQDRAPLLHETLGPWQGTFAWKEQQFRLKIPAKARLATLTIGLLGGTGEISFADLRLDAVPVRKGKK